MTPLIAACVRTGGRNVNILIPRDSPRDSVGSSISVRTTTAERCITTVIDTATASQNFQPQVLRGKPDGCPSESKTYSNNNKYGIIFGWMPDEVEKSNELGGSDENPVYDHLSETSASRKAVVVQMRNFEVLWDLPYRKDNSNAKKLGRESCCSYWNLGLDCGPFLRFSGKTCVKHHICSHDDCRELTNTTHRALQHRPTALCLVHSEKSIGMNKIHPTSPIP